MTITLEIYSSALHQDIIPSIITMHAATISHDRCLLRFHPPFDNRKLAKMTQFWTARLAANQAGERITILAFSVDQSPAPASNTTPELCGMIELGTPTSDTGPFRGDIEMLMVSPSHQRRGIAGLLMREVESVAKQHGRTLLQLGTTKGSAAEVYLYPRLGYVRCGEVPGYGIEPGTGRLVDGINFYKHLK